MRRDANLLTRYWIEFDTSTAELQRYVFCHAVGLGCGVTAYSYEDALCLLQAQVFRDGPIPPILSIIENVDISALDPGHVHPNIGVTIWRGIWYPNHSTWTPERNLRSTPESSS